MSLYPTITIPREIAVSQPLHEIVNGGLAVIPIDIAAGTGVTILVVQQAPTQDHSLRCFLSAVPGGVAVGKAPHSATYWHANRLPNEPVNVVAEGYDPPPGQTPVIVVAPGGYYLNVLNLVNTFNVFAVSLNDF